MKPQERIIVALDVPTSSEAMRIVHELGDLVSFYKIGLELLLADGLEGIMRDLGKDKQVFVDLKLPDDIPATVKAAVRVASRAGSRFLTLSHSVSKKTIAAAIEGREGRPHPELLYVPLLSSEARTESDADFIARASSAKASGVDGFIVSGPEIALVRKHFPTAPIISPGIRPEWAPADDHARSTTPREAVALGAHYLVIGRPIRTASDRRAAAQRVIDELG